MVQVFPTFKRLHLADFLALFVCSILAGIASGGLMNIINGLVSLSYFSLIFDFPGGSASWSRQELYWKSVQHGLIEGLVFGLAVACVFTPFVFVVSTASCQFRFSASYLPKMMMVAFFFWFIGGLNGIIVGAALPHLPSVLALGATPIDRCKFLWVGGSIYGAYFGSLIVLLLGCTWFKRDWRKQKARSSEERACSH